MYEAEGRTAYLCSCNAREVALYVRYSIEIYIAVELIRKVINCCAAISLYVSLDSSIVNTPLCRTRLRGGSEIVGLCLWFVVGYSSRAVAVILHTWSRHIVHFRAETRTVVYHLADGAYESAHVLVIVQVVVDGDTRTYVSEAVLLEVVQRLIHLAVIVCCRSKTGEGWQVVVVFIEVMHELQAVERTLWVVATPQWYRAVEVKHHVLEYLVERVGWLYAYHAVRQRCWLSPRPTCGVVLRL